MEEEHYFPDAPHNYPLCLNRQCPKASTCLRQLVEQAIPSSIEYWVVVSPKHQAALKGACPHYRSSKKVHYAKGCMNILENLPHKQRQRAMLLLVERFSQRTYYRIRKGERLLSPAEQKDIQNILKKCGVTQKQEFDAYVEGYEW
ncbi:MAG: hypothetical protein EGR83_21955 [Bacteroides cellulosilyticus]|nr:hypothetical protein [Bacteroides cellulosilyticus]